MAVVDRYRGDYLKPHKVLTQPSGVIPLNHDELRVSLPNLGRSSKGVERSPRLGFNNDISRSTSTDVAVA